MKRLFTYSVILIFVLALNIQYNGWPESSKEKQEETPLAVSPTLSSSAYSDTHILPASDEDILGKWQGLVVEEVEMEKYTTENLNIRKKPSASEESIAIAERSALLRVVGVVNRDWAEVEYGEIRGFAHRYFLTEEKPLPITSKKSNTLTFTLSHYTNLPEHNGGYTNTASGKPLAYGVVANNVLPFGTRIYLEGYGEMVVLDRGGKNFNTKTRLDVHIPPKPGESREDYINRIWALGVRKVQGRILD